MNVFRLGALSSFVALIPGALQAQSADESEALAVAKQTLERISDDAKVQLQATPKGKAYDPVDETAHDDAQKIGFGDVWRYVFD